MDWASKYRPKHVADVVGNSSALHLMVEWARSWTTESKPLLLHGKPGTGKTSSVYALATDFSWEVIELNASDQRTRDVIKKVAGTSSTTGSLLGSLRKLILLDEADNLHGTADRGGARAILEVIRNTRQPVVLIVNDLYQLSPDIRSRSEPVPFRALPARSIVPRLRYICSAECLKCSDGALREIAESAGGDMRAAITMLEAAAIGRSVIGDTDVSTSRKDERSSVFDLISAVYGKTGTKDLMRIVYDVDETPDTLAQWIESNIGHIHDRTRYFQAYQHLLRADEYIGLTYRQQYHTLWRYATALMILGVSEAAGGEGIHARITSPERWRKMGSYRKQKVVRTGMLGKIGRSLHLSQYMLRDTYITPVSLLADRDPLSFAREFSLDADELSLLIHDKTRAQKVLKTLMDEERLLEKEREKAERIKKKKQGASISGEERVNGPGGYSTRIPNGDEQATPYPPGAPHLPSDPDEGPLEPSQPRETSSEEEKQAGKRTQTTLFDGF
ncbi:MAG: replication factor C large subunit [Methanoregulaceae archaeon]|jgi:replication factor C large subunit|nr:replication factor C large subunit [Methanoregulaceae archaeon]